VTLPFSNSIESLQITCPAAFQTERMNEYFFYLGEFAFFENLSIK
jgi:hypothetical protein